MSDSINDNSILENAIRQAQPATDPEITSRLLFETGWRAGRRSRTAATRTWMGAALILAATAGWLAVPRQPASTGTPQEQIASPDPEPEPERTLATQLSSGSGWSGSDRIVTPRDWRNARRPPHRPVTASPPPARSNILTPASLSEFAVDI